MTAASTSAQVAPSYFVPLTPCRLFDSRVGGALPIVAGTTTPITVRGVCEVPERAAGVAVAVHAFAPGPGGGALVLWRGCDDRPPTATIGAGMGTAGGTGVTMPTPAYPPDPCDEDLELYNGTTTHVAIDVVGFLLPVTIQKEDVAPEDLEDPGGL